MWLRRQSGTQTGLRLLHRQVLGGDAAPEEGP